jgi:energy-converting hydrogenase B subunit D
MEQLLVFVIVIMMLLGALAAMMLKNLIAATAATSVVSLGLTVLFVLMRAPDVAMTEAVVGAGLSALILSLGLRRLGLWQLENNASAEADESEK